MLVMLLLTFFSLNYRVMRKKWTRTRSLSLFFCNWKIPLVFGVFFPSANSSSVDLCCIDIVSSLVTHLTGCRKERRKKFEVSCARLNSGPECVKKLNLFSIERKRSRKKPRAEKTHKSPLSKNEWSGLISWCTAQQQQQQKKTGKKRKSHLSNIIYFMFILVSFNFLTTKLNVPEIIRRIFDVSCHSPSPFPRSTGVLFASIWQMDQVFFLLLLLLLCD